MNIPEIRFSPANQGTGTLVGFSQRRLVRRGRHAFEAGDWRGELRAEDGLVKQESLFGRAGEIEIRC
jgi:hypothetical protein